MTIFEVFFSPKTTTMKSLYTHACNAVGIQWIHEQYVCLNLNAKQIQHGTAKLFNKHINTVIEQTSCPETDSPILYTFVWLGNSDLLKKLQILGVSLY